MRWVAAIGLSIRARRGQQGSRTAPLRAKGPRVKQRRVDLFMAPAGGDPGTMNAVSRRWIFRPPGRKIRFVCLGLDGRPVRTAGNEGVPQRRPACGQPASKKARTVVASRRPRVGGWPLIRPGSLLPGYLPDILAISRSGDAHRHVRLWASADVMIPPVTINEKFAPTHFFAPPQLPAAGHETSCQSRRFARNLACVVTSCWLPRPINWYARA